MTPRQWRRRELIALGAAVGIGAEQLPLIDAIEAFWSDAEHQQADSWLAHLDIDAVMLATSLAPAGFLDLA